MQPQFLKEMVESLEREQLEELQSLIAARLAEYEEAQEQKGHIELKMIGKWGPYAYLRYWEDGHLKSKYLGKVKNSLDTNSSDITMQVM